MLGRQRGPNLGILEKEQDSRSYGNRIHLRPWRPLRRAWAPEQRRTLRGLGPNSLLAPLPRQVAAGTIVNEALSCVDFLPTTLSLMEVKTAGKEQGRDASSLFRGEGKEWNDIAFIRSTSTGKPWLCAVADDHKLVFSAMDEPWLFDLAEDPDEMDNCYEIPKYSKVVLSLTKALESYCRKYEDPYGEVPEIKAAIKKAAG